MKLREIVLSLTLVGMVGCVSDGPKVLPRKEFKEEYKPKKNDIPRYWYYWADRKSYEKS